MKEQTRMNKIKISVIIPVYNAEQYLKQCMESVLGQTLKEIEIICIDDGSTDNSLNILREYQKKDNRIIIFSQENQGAAVARNKGLELAKGIYVAFMDPDDYYPDSEVLLSLFEISCDKQALIAGGSLSLDRNGEFCQLKYEIQDERIFLKDGFLLYEDYQYDFYYQRFIYSKRLLDENFIRFPLYRRGQDIPFFVEAMIAAKKFYAVERVTYCYRVGHKKINWGNDTIAIHAIQATSEIIKIAESHQFKKLSDRCIARLLYYAEEILYCNNNIEVLEVLDNEIRKINDENSEEIVNKKEAVLIKIRFLLQLEKSKKNKNVEIIAGESYPAKVSIIIPVYNVEKFLVECLDSICGQTLQEIEIVCVNDGSTDKSLDILKRYAYDDQRIIVLSQENSGLSVARNSGIKFAHSEYIYFCDSDDKLEITALENLYNRAKKDNLEMLYFNADVFFENKELENRLYQYKTYYVRKKDYKKIYDGKDMLNSLLKNKDYIPSAYLNFLKRDFVLNNQLLFEPGILHEDNLWSFKCALTANRVGYYPKAFFHRRIRENSIVSQKKSFEHAYGYFISAIHGIEFLKTVRLSNDEFENINKLILRWIRNSQDIYGQLSNDEKSIYENLNNNEKIMFKILILGGKEDKVNHIFDKIDKTIKYYNKNGLKSTLGKIKFELVKYLRR